MVENGCETNWKWQIFMFGEIRKRYHNIENESVSSEYFHTVFILMHMGDYGPNSKLGQMSHVRISDGTI